MKIEGYLIPKRLYGEQFRGIQWVASIRPKLNTDDRKEYIHSKEIRGQRWIYATDGKVMLIAKDVFPLDDGSYQVELETKSKIILVKSKSMTPDCLPAIKVVEDFEAKKEDHVLIECKSTYVDDIHFELAQAGFKMNYQNLEMVADSPELFRTITHTGDPKKVVVFEGEHYAAYVMPMRLE